MTRHPAGKEERWAQRARQGEHATPGFDDVASQLCLWCGATVPSGRFCRACGAHLDANDRLPWLRPRSTPLHRASRCSFR